MKNTITLSFLFLFLNQVHAQDSISPRVRDTSWQVSGFFGVNASQTSLSNWQGGGQDNRSINGIFNFNTVYKRNANEVWTNKLDAQYGLLQAGYQTPFRKNLDQLFALTKYEIASRNKHIFYTLQSDYRTQFAPGYRYEGDSIVGKATSDMNSPGYIQLALGMAYKPVNYFSITVAPAAGKVTLVNRQYLADDGEYGVQPAVRDANGNVVLRGRKIRYEFGGRIMIKFKKDIFKNVTLDSYLDLFSNYEKNPQNIDVVFNNLLTIKIYKYFSASIVCQMIYDDDITIKRDLNNDGRFDRDGEINGPRLQVISTVGFGFGYKF